MLCLEAENHVSTAAAVADGAIVPRVHNVRAAVICRVESLVRPADDLRRLVRAVRELGQRHGYPRSRRQLQQSVCESVGARGEVEVV